jgi:predicted nuclease of restriction endonuclease-like (RecB) superfamily
LTSFVSARGEGVSRSGQKILYNRIRLILESARSGVARTVNTTQVAANWLIGREIVEEEQKGRNRAEYGKQLIVQLSARLKADYGGGYSAQNLFYMRQFYQTYSSLMSESIILHALRGKSPRLKSEGTEEIHALHGKAVDANISDAVSRNLTKSGVPQVLDMCHAPRGESWGPGHLHPNLSWTHYRTLLRVDKAEARAFYEIEAVKNNWTARELERQINSLLFEQLAKSKDKAGLMRLARKGHKIQGPEDVFKDPVVMEFLGLPENHRLVESKREEALIGNLL